MDQPRPTASNCNDVVQPPKLPPRPLTKEVYKIDREGGYVKINKTRLEIGALQVLIYEYVHDGLLKTVQQLAAREYVL